MALLPANIAALHDRARRLRVHSLQMVHHAGGGHVGGALSAADIVTVLYFHVLRLKEDPSWADRDRFILSKGHAASVLYAALAERGYLPLSELDSFDEIDTRLQGHPDMRKTPGVDMSTGALGQGLSTGLGMALAAPLLGRRYRVFVLLGDGECQEGQVWEAAMAAPVLGAANLTAIVDYNKLSQTGPSTTLLPAATLGPRWESFGWAVAEVDGHNMADLVDVLSAPADRPRAVIAHTVKGKGVSLCEGRTEWHSRALNDAELARALAELAPARAGQGGQYEQCDA